MGTWPARAVKADTTQPVHNLSPCSPDKVYHILSGNKPVVVCPAGELLVGTSPAPTLSASSCTPHTCRILTRLAAGSYTLSRSHWPPHLPRPHAYPTHTTSSRASHTHHMLKHTPHLPCPHAPGCRQLHPRRAVDAPRLHARAVQRQERHKRSHLQQEVERDRERRRQREVAHRRHRREHVAQAKRGDLRTSRNKVCYDSGCPRMLRTPPGSRFF